MTAYNSYRIKSGRRNLFSPAELARMKAADERIEAEFAKALARARKAIGRKAPGTAGRYANETPEQREHRLAANREYGRKHRYDISQQRKARMATDPEFSERVRASNRESAKRRYNRKRGKTACR